MSLHSQHDFVTADDRSWTVVDLMFSRFKPNFRGQFVAGRPPIVGSQVRIEADGSCASVWERGQARASLCNRVLGGSHGGERGEALCGS
mmetsp:Transcript_20361/g.60542  ORF Transcript_20361/g.60542 Transcript_20361/m.60542 type:complete len:89 (-) Transcript_20361:400-666(-)